VIAVLPLRKPAAAQASVSRPDTAQASGGRSAGGNRPATEESENDEGQSGADCDNDVEASGEEVN